MVEFSITFPSERRFDDRHLRPEDDGRDFESFVYEALSLLIDSDTLRPGFGRGRDGAIDHTIEDCGGRTVVECKFIGKTATGGPQARWAEVRRHLNENLPRLAATYNVSDQRQSPYAPWLDQRHRITGYLFCVSYQFAHVEERAALEKQIADDFLKLSNEAAQLSHLASIVVQVRGWDDFQGELRCRFPLRYRWFGDLPPGVAPIRNKRFESRSFRRFLFTDALPFFSREKYLADAGAQQITREDQLINDLSATPGDEALIITGAGGVGKTRLGLELCDRLSNQGWLGLRLTESATSRSIADLVKAHATPAKIVLLLDYAEKANDLTAIIEEITLVNDSNEHCIRVIATCRVSSFSIVQDTLAPLAPRQITIGTPRASDSGEIAFTEWVVSQILAYGHVPYPERLARVCHGLPILATFAMFLHKQNPARFHEQFGDLGGAPDFRVWLARRLDIVLNARHRGQNERTVLQRLALLALRLPMPRSEADQLIDHSELEASLLETMGADLWIEYEDDHVIATHDVFADAIVAHYIFETAAVATTRFAELLRAASDQGFLARALVAGDRLASHPDFRAVDGRDIVRSLMARGPAPVISAHERLLRGRLLSDHAKIQLIAEYPALKSAIAANRDCDVSMSQLAENLARLRRLGPSTQTEFVAEAAGVIAPLLAASLTDPHPSNMLLRRAFSLLPEAYRSSISRRISMEVVAPQTHYLLVAWLYAGLPTSEIAEATEAWLSANASRSAKTSFLIRAWLDARAPRAPIDRHVLAWIDEFGETESAQFVYYAWLEAGGERDLIDRHILSWIRAHGHIDNARFVYSAWLHRGGPHDLVEGDLLAWLQTFGTTKGASFIYPAWLDVGGRRDLVDHHVLAWIESFGITEGANFVYRAWLKAAGPRNLVDRPMLAWMDAFGKTEDARFIYQAWLEAGGERRLIDHHIFTWIKVHGLKATAESVYLAWLNAGGQVQSIDRDLLAWIATFGTTEHADYLYRAWLDAGGSFETIAVPCLAWFHAHATNYKASFLIKYITQYAELPDESLHAAITWCALFSDHEEVIWQATSLLIRHASRPEATALVRTFLLNVRRLDLARLSRVSAKEGEDGTKLSKMVISGLAWSLGVLQLDKIDRDELDAAHARLLTNSQIYEAACATDRIFIYPALVHHVAMLIERGLVQLHLDHAALERFANWMRAWPEHARDDLELAISRLQLAAPSGPWDAITASGRSRDLASAWAWKDEWQKQWNVTRISPARRSSLEGSAIDWLGRFDLEQRGWTSVWKALWAANETTSATRATLVNLAKDWLQVVAPEHPVWATVWISLWNASESEPDSREFLAAQARVWLAGTGPHIGQDLVLRALSARAY
jgi:hypothetical protein